MPTPITEPAPRPAPPPAVVVLAAAEAEVQPCPNRATCKSQTCRRALAVAPAAETEH